jgi:hypothetical protein
MGLLPPTDADGHVTNGHVDGHVGVHVDSSHVDGHVDGHLNGQLWLYQLSPPLGSKSSRLDSGDPNAE